MNLSDLRDFVDTYWDEFHYLLLTRQEMIHESPKIRSIRQWISDNPHIIDKVRETMEKIYRGRA